MINMTVKKYLVNKKICKKILVILEKLNFENGNF